MLGVTGCWSEALFGPQLLNTLASCFGAFLETGSSTFNYHPRRNTKCEEHEDGLCQPYVRQAPLLPLRSPPLDTQKLPTLNTLPRCHHNAFSLNIFVPTAILSGLALVVPSPEPQLRLGLNNGVACGPGVGWNCAGWCMINQGATTGKCMTPK